MRTVTVRLPAASFSATMANMREWLDRNRSEPTKFRYDQDDGAIIVSVEFPNEEEGEAFAGRFDVTRRLDRHRPVWEVPPRAVIVPRPETRLERGGTSASSVCHSA